MRQMGTMRSKVFYMKQYDGDDALGAVNAKRTTLGLSLSVRLLIFFFFQAEDGIRDGTVTGVQTCALPICLGGHCNGGMFAFEVARRLVAEGDEVDALVIIDGSARNARFRLVSRLARALAWLARLDRSAEAALFLGLRDGATELAWRIAGWRRRAVPDSGASRPVGPTPGDAAARGHGGEDLDLAASVPTWQDSERVVAFRRVTRCHVPGRYAGSVAVLVPEQRPSPRRDLWWSLVADH